MIESRPLPNGRIPFESIANPELKRVVMLVNDNICSLKKQLEELQTEVLKIERRK